MTTKELREKIPGIIERKKLMYSSLLPGRDNPQVQEMMHRVDAEIITFTAVLDALKGNTMLINTF